MATHNGTQRVNHFPFFVLCSAKGKKAPGSTRRPTRFLLLPLNLNLSVACSLGFSSTLSGTEISFVPPGTLPVHRYKSLALHSGAYIIRQQPNALPLMQPVARTRFGPHCVVVRIYILRIRPALVGSFTDTEQQKPQAFTDRAFLIRLRFA